MRRACGIAAAGLALACAVGTQGAEPPAPAPAAPRGPPTATAAPPAPAPAAKPTERRGGLPAVVRYGPSAMRYVVHRRLHVEQTYGGQAQTQDMGARVFLRVTITGPADTAGYPVTFTVDSVVPDSGTPEVIASGMTRVRAVILAGRLLPEGEFRGAALVDSSMAQNVAQLVGNFRDFLPHIPAAGVAVGASWADTLVAVQRSGGSAITRLLILHSRAPGWEDHGGARSLRIETSATYTVTGSGQNSGQAFELNGAGTSTALNFVAEDGRFLGGESKDSTGLTISLPVQRLTIPVTQVLHSTVSSLP